MRDRIRDCGSNVTGPFEDQVGFEAFSKSDFAPSKVLDCEAVPKSKKLTKYMLDDGSGAKMY